MSHLLILFSYIFFVRDGLYNHACVASVTTINCHCICMRVPDSCSISRACFRIVSKTSQYWSALPQPQKWTSGFFSPQHFHEGPGLLLDFLCLLLLTWAWKFVHEVRNLRIAINLFCREMENSFIEQKWINTDLADFERSALWCAHWGGIMKIDHTEQVGMGKI